VLFVPVKFHSFDCSGGRGRQNDGPATKKPHFNPISHSYANFVSILRPGLWMLLIKVLSNLFNILAKAVDFWGSL
jgi:hypothetical protein